MLSKKSQKIDFKQLVNTKNMFNENTLRKEAELSEDEKMIKELDTFIDANGFTSKQMNKALERVYGIGGGDEEKDDSVEKIFLKMEEMADKGVGVNRLAELIESKQRHEDAVPRYYQYIESLDVADKGKKALHSIVERRRSGKMEFFIDGEMISSFVIKKSDKPVERLAEELMDVIGRIMTRIPRGKKCEFIFEED